MGSHGYGPSPDKNNNDSNNADYIQLDVTDLSFTSEVLRLAPFCPVLLYSILALSAIRMNRVADYDANEGEQYHEKCVELLLTMLDD